MPTAAECDRPVLDVDQRGLELKFEMTAEQLHQLDQHPALSELAVGM